MDSEVAVVVSMTATRVPDQETGVLEPFFASSALIACAVDPTAQSGSRVCRLGFLAETADTVSEAAPEEWTRKTVSKEHEKRMR